MDTHGMEETAAQVLLDRGVGFHIPAPLLLRWFGKPTIGISVKCLRLGTLLHLSRLLPQDALERVEQLIARKELVAVMDSELTSLKLTYIEKYTKRVCLAVACGLLNEKWKIRFFSRPLGRYLRHHCTADQLQELVLWLFAYGRAEAFMNTTRLLAMMRKTMPMNLGQARKRS